MRRDEHAVLGELTVAAYATLGYLGDDYADELRDVAGRAAAAEVLVAVEGDRMLGGVTYVAGPGIHAEFAAPDEAGIRHLAVAPDARRRGAGAVLVEACVARARSEGKAQVALFTTPWMTSAHRLYDRLGFRRAPERDWEPQPGVPLLGYVVDLRR